MRRATDTGTATTERSTKVSQAPRHFVATANGGRRHRNHARRGDNLWRVSDMTLSHSCSDDMSRCNVTDATGLVTLVTAGVNAVNPRLYDPGLITRMFSNHDCLISTGCTILGNRATNLVAESLFSDACTPRTAIIPRSH